MLSDISMISRLKEAYDSEDVEEETNYFCSTNCLYMHRLSSGQNGNETVVIPIKKKANVEMRNKSTMKKPKMSTKGM